MYYTHKLTLLLCLMALLYHPLKAQEPLKTKFGKIADSEIKRSSYESFPEADAIFLMDIGRTHVTNMGGLKLLQDRHYRIKILTEEGQSHANIAIPYYGRNKSQSVIGIKAITHYEENGKTVQQKISNSDIFDEDINGYWRQKKFAMPNVNPGSIVEIKYTISSENFASIKPWYFQKPIPVLYSKFSKEVIEGFYYSTVSRGEVIPIERTRDKRAGNSTTGGYDTDVETFIAQKIPPLTREPYIAHLQDYVAHITFELKKINIPGIPYRDFEISWFQLNEQWLTEMESTYKVGPAVKKELEKIDLSGDDDAKIATIFQYVQQNFSYNDRLGIYPSPKVRELISKREGNASAINVLLLNLLKEAGLEAYPCLASSRENGLVQKIFPTTEQFNLQIVAIKQGEEYLLLDASQKNIPLGMLPIRDLNRTGLIVNPGGHKWISLAPTKNYSVTKSANLSIKEDGGLTGKITSIYNGYGAYTKRNALNKAEDKDTYLSTSLLNGFEDAELIEYEMENETDINKPFKTICEIEVNDNIGSSIGDRIYLKPLLNESIDKNPFTLEKRSYPIDFGYGSMERIVFSYTLPEGYEVESVPEPIRMGTSSKDFSFQYQAQALGNMLQVQYLLHIKKAYHSPQNYGEIKAFYDEVVKKHGEQIVLRKKS